MLHWITIVTFLGLTATAVLAKPLEGQEGISDISQHILESKNAGLDSSILHRVPRSRHGHHHHMGRSSARLSGRGAGVTQQAGRGNVFNWDIDASKGKKGKKGVNKIETDDMSIENNK